MSTTSSTRALFLICAMITSGCAIKTSEDLSDTGSAGGSGGSGGGGGGSSVSIYSIQMGEINEGTRVTIKDAVVTTPITEGEYPGFYIQSAEGGAYNGLYIFKYDEVDYVPSVGDTINITGTYSEYYSKSQLTVEGPSDIEVTGSGDVVITDVAEEPENWEAYESVMIRFSDMEISDASKLYEWGAVELAIGCWMDNDFTTYEAEDGATYESITGPLNYSFEKYSILPRTADDLQGYSGSTGGGGGGGGTATDATIAQVQQGELSEGATVTVSNVVATSNMMTKTNDEGETEYTGFFAQDDGGGEWSGVYMYTYSEVGEALSGIAPGDVLTVTGEIVEFYDLTEIKITSMDDVVVSGDTADVVANVISETPASWETWEGCLVEVENVEITGDEDTYGAAPMNNGALIDDELFRFDVANGDSFSSVLGIITYSYSEYRLLPRSDADFNE
ncbi:MAG: hypothetical protein CL930_06865 [Deltaproteobacteria bacterium]|nr:hypothetical protein [Deltaproteobacteria bacterium]